MSEDEIIILANKVWGLDVHLRKLKEESAELIVAVAHYEDQRADCIPELFEEMIDVEILLSCIKETIFHWHGAITEYSNIRDDKFQRLHERLLEKKPEVKNV